MEAALEILAQTGNQAPVNNLLQFGSWTSIPAPPPGNYSWSTLANSLNSDVLIVSPAWGAVQGILDSLF